MKFLSSKRNYWTNDVTIVDVVSIQVARVTRTVHCEHVRVATTVEVIRTPKQYLINNTIHKYYNTNK